jgi:Flp pilus assembly protein TadD/tRNA A-37 threonylcarbamoyl transferase component Bud32
MVRSQILDLIVQFEESRQNGQPKDPADICPYPELLAEFLQALEALGLVDRELGSAASAGPESPLGRGPRAERDQAGPAPASASTPHPAARVQKNSDLPHIPGYELHEVLDRGGMGVLYRATDHLFRRSLAVKVLAAKYRDNADLKRRFLEEAQLTGQVQHPGVPPVHDLGELPDGRPYLAMKLIKGRSLASLLSERTSLAQDQPRLVGIFEQVCRTLAYSHSKGIIHRDLKPSNVMVGAFGEVQLIDWGLAKVLATPASEASDAAAPLSTIWTVRTEEPSTATRPGQAMGTPAYMAPEQARGETAQLDARCDVFGLGAILCEMLTGQPPFSGCDPQQVLALAREGDLAEAFARLEQCGADRELLQIARQCLAAAKEERPADGGAVLAAVTVYLALVQERLRRAEIKRAQAEVKAAEEQKRRLVERQKRRLALGLAAAMLLVVAGGGGGAWWLQQRRQAADGAVVQALNEARLLFGQAQRNPLTEAAKYLEALKVARQAKELASTGGASAAMRRQAADLVAELEMEADAAKRDRRLLAALLEVHGHTLFERPRYSRDKSGMVIALAEPSADERFAAAFREWGLNVDATPTDETAARLKGRPTAVVMEVVAAVDEWTVWRQREKPPRDWQRLAALAAALDDQPNPRRRELRAIITRGRLPLERALAEVSRALLPLPPLTGVAPWEDRNRLRQLAQETDVTKEPVHGLFTLWRAFYIGGDAALAERLMRDAVRARPQEVILQVAMGAMLEVQQPPRWSEAIECYAAARALRPELGSWLANALVGSGRVEDGLALSKHLTAEWPDNPRLHLVYGNALFKQRRYGAAAAAYREAIRLKPDYPEAHHNLGVTLSNQGRSREAEEAVRESIRLKPDTPLSHLSLGIALSAQGRYKEAEEAVRQAIRLKPDYPEAHNNLGYCLARQDRHKEAEGEYRAAMGLEPDDPVARSNLAGSLGAQRRFKEAEAACREALRLKPDYPEAHNNLGHALREQGRLKEAETAHREAIRLQPDFPGAYDGLGTVLYNQERFQEAEAAYHAAIHLQPGFHLAYNNLGVCLARQGRFIEAEAACSEALRLKPDYAEAYKNLGIALHGQRRYREAEMAFRRTIDLHPNDAEPHYNLGNALASQGRDQEAELEFRTATCLKPDYFDAHVNLGITRGRLGRHKEAEAAYRAALHLQPQDPSAHRDLGIALDKQGRHRQAEAEFCEAIRLKPDYAAAHHSLGIALGGQKRHAEAIAAFQKAIELNPKHVNAHYTLGIALTNQCKLPEGIASFQKVIELEPRNPQAHGAMGLALLRQGSFSEARQAMQKALSLLPPGHPIRNTMQKQLKECEQFIVLEERMQLVTQGKADARAAELVAMAQMCTRYKQRHGTAAELYAKAFAAEPALAADPGKPHRYDAACAAALAADGQGDEARKLTAEQKRQFRRQARDLLRAELDVCAKLVKDGKPEGVMKTVTRLAHWQTDPDLAAVREAKELGKLPDDERAAWQQFWRDVGEMQKQARAVYTETEHKGKLTATQLEQPYPIKMAAGTTYVIDMTSAEFDTYLRLEDASGKVLAENDNISATKRNSRIIFTAPVDGSYRIVATSFQQRGSGAYTLTIRAIAGKAK